MVATFTTNTHLELQATGDNSGTWGSELNTAVFTVIDSVFGGVQTLSLSSTDVTLSTTQTQVNYIKLTGTLTANVSVIFPAIGRTYFIRNSTTGAFAVTLKIGAGATAIIPQGNGGFYVLDGTDVVSASAARGIGTLASATTTDLGAAATAAVNVTGSTTMASFGSTAPAGTLITVVATTGTPKLTYNATSMILPGAADIIAQTGDSWVALALGSGNWRVVEYTRAAVAPNTGAGLAGGFRNLKVTATGATTATVTADGIALFDSNGNAAYVSAVNVTNTNSANGANGLDVGSIALSTWYYIYVIYNPTTQTTASLVSLSATAPTMPSGYTYKLRVGALRNAASGGYWRTIQYGRRATIAIGTNPTVAPIIVSGAAGSPITPTWVAQSVSSFVPPTASAIHLTLTTAGGGGVEAIAAPNNSYGAGVSITNPAPLQSTTGTTVNSGVSDLMMLESTNIYYASGGSNSALSTNGWEDNL